MIIVSDQDRALDFYMNTFGWEKRMDTPLPGDDGTAGNHWLTVAPPGAETGLVLATAQFYGAANGNLKRDSGISLITGNIDELYKTLSEPGVSFTQKAETMPWGQRATWLSDPEDNTFFVVEECVEGSGRRHPPSVQDRKVTSIPKGRHFRTIKFARYRFRLQFEATVPDKRRPLSGT